MTNVGYMNKSNITTTADAICNRFRAEFTVKGCRTIADAAVKRAKQAGFLCNGENHEREMTYLVKAPVTSSDFKNNHSVGEIKHIHVPSREACREMRKSGNSASCKAMVSQSAQSLSDRRCFNDIAKFSGHQRSVKMRAPMPIGVLVSVMLCAVLLTFVLHISVSIAEVTRSTGELEDRIAVLSQTQEDLSLSLEARSDIRSIEQIATEELGMVKKDYVLRKYVDVYSGDQIDVFEGGEGNSDSTFLSAIVEKIKEYID